MKLIVDISMIHMYVYFVGYIIYIYIYSGDSGFPVRGFEKKSSDLRILGH